MDSKLFGKKISHLRKEKQLTQAQLAEKLNISNKTVSRWETAEGYPEITLIAPLAEALGVTTDELLKDTSKKVPPCDGRREKRLISAWKNLTIFNKVAATGIGIVLFGIVFSIASMLFLSAAGEHGSGMIVTFMPLVLSFCCMLVPKACGLAAALGIVLGLLNLCEKQYKAGVILGALNFCFPFVLVPLLLFVSI